MMREIHLSNGGITLVDDDDYDVLNKYKWRKEASGYVFRTGSIKGRNVPVRMHRVVMEAPKGLQVDHINGNKLDNRKENLRLATRSENQRNVGKRSSNKSGYKGVRWVPSPYNKWRVDIRTDEGKKFIGHFNNILEAAKAYNDAALNYHGEFANLNEIREEDVS